MRCPSCGEEIESSREYCPGCGNFLGEGGLVKRTLGKDMVFLMNIVVWTVSFTAVMMIFIGDNSLPNRVLAAENLFLLGASLIPLIPLNFYLYRKGIIG